MIDIHCHIIPGIDDGARNLSESLAMLDMQQVSGVKRVYLTPHFYPETKSMDAFLAERKKAWNGLSASLGKSQDLQIRLGAEISYSQELLSLDLKMLTLGESDYLLLEFPCRYPAYAVQIMQRILDDGFIPILAHVERYSYFRQEPNLLKQLTDIGVLAQVSAKSLFDKRDKRFALACLNHNLAHIVASDAHNTVDRKPSMDLLSRLPEEIKQLHEMFSNAVWQNDLPPYIRATNVKRSFFNYY